MEDIEFIKCSVCGEDIINCEDCFKDHVLWECKISPGKKYSRRIGWVDKVKKIWYNIFFNKKN